MNSILQFEAVTVGANPPYDSSLSNVSFNLAPGGLLLLRMENDQQRLPLGDAAEGLEPPLAGRVMFGGVDWQRMSADESADRRGTIGRIFAHEGWLSGQPVDQNVTLAQRHHTRRPVREIEDEAATLAQWFGLPGLPRGKPARMLRQDLQKAACFRAFLGQPVLIILENPTRGVHADIIAPLINQVHTARRRGAAVLWLTSDPLVWNNPGLRATTRCTLFGAQLQPVNEAA